MNQLLNVLFNNLNCRSANITFDTSSPNLKLIEKFCRDKKFSFREKPNFGREIIPVETSYDLYYNSLKNKIRKEFRRIKRNLDRSGSWKISCTGIHPESIKRVLAVDQKSWKAAWRAKNNWKEDAALRIILEASQPNGEVEPLYESKVWFLDVDGVAIAYLIVLSYKGTAVFIKTSFNAHFKRFSPSKFLINSVIREVFRKETVNKIDFVTNLPFIKAWKPLCEHRTRVIMEVNPFLSRVIRVVLRNPLMQKVVK